MSIGLGSRNRLKHHLIRGLQTILTTSIFYLLNGSNLILFRVLKDLLLFREKIVDFV